MARQLNLARVDCSRKFSSRLERCSFGYTGASLYLEAISPLDSTTAADTQRGGFGSDATQLASSNSRSPVGDGKQIRFSRRAAATNDQLSWPSLITLEWLGAIFSPGP